MDIPVGGEVSSDKVLDVWMGNGRQHLREQRKDRRLIGSVGTRGLSVGVT